MTHTLKIVPEFYDALISGNKTFEIRKNDRKFKVGDLVTFREWDDLHQVHIKSLPVTAVITYITDYEQKEGFVVFSFGSGATLTSNLHGWR